MTRLEITELCAEAFDCKPNPNGAGWDDPRNNKLFNPLRDDEQAMALLKKFQLGIDPPYHIDGYRVYYQYPSEAQIWARHEDLNQAICECVAQLQRVRTRERKLHQLR